MTEVRTRQHQSSVSAVLLAAGSSRRFARGSKLLADAGGRPLIAWATGALAASRVAELIVVTGPDPEPVEAALRAFAPRFVHNPDHLTGMGSSIATGTAAVSPSSAGALISPGDMPGLTASLIDRLVAAFEQAGGGKIVYPRMAEGRQGNPVIWPRRFFDRLIGLRGAEGGKGLLQELSTDTVAVSVGDTGASLDIDTVEDLERYLRLEGR
jgi:molybdenum cofactor cytidylyltransferase